MSDDDSSNEKETVPPPPGNDEFDLPEDEQTVMAQVPEDLIAELTRREEAQRAGSSPPSSGRGAAGPNSEGGLRQMFARNPMHIRDVLPTEAEGDALLDMLFDDATTVAPSPAERETEADPDEVQPTIARPAPAVPRPAGIPRPASPPGLPPRPGPAAPPPGAGAPGIEVEEVPELAGLVDEEDEEAGPLERPTRAVGQSSPAAAFAASPPPGTDDDDDDAPTRMKVDDDDAVATHLFEPPAQRLDAREVPSDAPPVLFGEVSSASPASPASPDDIEELRPSAVEEVRPSLEELRPSAVQEVRPSLEELRPSQFEEVEDEVPPPLPPRQAPAAMERLQTDRDLADVDLATAGLDDDEDDDASAALAAEADHHISAEESTLGDEEDAAVSPVAAGVVADAADAVEAPSAPRPREGLPSLLLEGERDASLVLAEARAREAFLARAAWILEEARLLEDRPARATQLLVASELFALCGDDASAAAIANEARDAHPASPLASRQHRAFLVKRGDFTAVLEAVDAETRAMPTPEARCHGSWLGAEIARVVLGDDAGARRRADQALRVLPGDPRPHVQRVVDAVSGRAERPTPIGKVRPVGAAEVPALTALDEACIHLARVRGEPVRGDEAISRSPLESLLEARAAIDGGDRAGAIAALDAVTQGRLAGGKWLVGLLADAHGSTRDRASEALGAVARGSHGAFARRALAATAIARGDAAEAHAAATGDGSFDLADRLALAALAGAPVTSVARDLEAASHDPDLAPLAVAAAGALPVGEGGTRPEIFAVGSPRSRAALKLGRRLGQGEQHTLREASTALAALQPGGAAAALGIELDLADHRAADVARALEKWGGGGSEGEIAPLLAAGLVAEVAGDIDTAKGAYERAAAARVQHEGAARGLAAHLDPAEIPGLLAEHAASLEEGPRQALLFVEAALRLLDLGAETEGETVLTRAAGADPSLPFALHLLERLARNRGDRDALIECLRNRRETSDDPVERAHDFVREALLISDIEGASPGALLEQALAGQPDDVALRELYERLLTETPPDRAAWREQRAERSTGTEAMSFALEAALDLERAGDVESAARAVRIAAQRAEGAEPDGDARLLPIYAHRYGVAGHGTAELVDELLPLARAAQDPHERREIYERLAELDELGRKDVASGVLWRRTILEEDPTHLPTLRRIETALMRENRVDELEPIALEIARVLGQAESVAHAALAARLRSRVAWDESFEAVRLAYRFLPRGPWVLRQMAAHARAKGDTALALEVDRQLLVRTERTGEVAALALRAARGAAALGDEPLAVSLFTQATKAMPTHLLARLELAGALEAQEDREGAAAQLEAAAEAAASTEWKVTLDFEAAVLWQDAAGDTARARAALERVIALEPMHEQAFERLRGIYVAGDLRAELAELLERRIDSITDPKERVEMEVMRGRALAQVGEHASAKRALAAALESSPDHVEALETFAELCTTEEDWDGAEQALIRLARLAVGPDKQIEAYLRLGELYDVHLPNPERAELAYGEVLKRKPGHARARERLVALFRREGDFGRAIEEQNVLVASAEQPEEKARRTVELASILEAMGDMKKAEATLVAARKAFPKSSVALEALVALYQRTGQQQAGTMLLDRAVADARRALGTGRFEGYLFETLAAAASLRGRHDAALACKTVVEALEGVPAGAEPTSARGAGERAGDADLDDLVAPDLLSPAFRDLLARTGSMLDLAVPYDPASVRATPLPPPSASLAEEIRDIAIGYGIHRIEILSSAVLGHVCVAANAHPPTIVIGQSLLATDNESVRTFLVHRALKVIQSNAAVFSRTAPIDLWPLLAAYLKCFTPGWNPQGVDATRLTNFYGRLSRAVPAGMAHDTSAMAQEIIGTIGNRAPTLATAVNGWGDRCALLASADPTIALTAIAWAGGHSNAPPPPGKDRLVWVGRNAEAREVILFAVSDAYVEARQRLGLG